MNIGTLPDWIAVGTAITATVLTYLTLLANRYAVKAAAFDRRWAVYDLTRKAVVDRWAQIGWPDTDVIRELAEAKEQSRFLFSSRVTDFLQQTHKEALEAYKVLQQGARDDTEWLDRMVKLTELGRLLPVFFEDMHLR